MDFSISFEALLSSAVISAVVSAIVSLRTSDRNIQIENVTQERAKWRNMIRILSKSIIKSAQLEDKDLFERHCSHLSLIVNPLDEEDIKLVKAARNIIETSDRALHIQEFIDRVALLLKHDWERAKREARPWYHKGKPLQRISYDKSSTAGHSPISHPLDKNKERRRKLVQYFFALSISAGVIFFLATGLTEPFQSLIKMFNDKNTEEPLIAWVSFATLSAIFGSLWSALYLWFKGSEKKFLDTWFSK